MDCWSEFLPHKQRHWGFAFLAEAPLAIADAAEETFLIGYFDADHKLMQIDVITSHAKTSAPVPFRKITGSAINLEARSVVLAHNHPSGDPLPSRADIYATQDIARLFRPLDIHVDDHLIVSRDQLFSFRDAGML
jgi:DNA repair protein RadC